MIKLLVLDIDGSLTDGNLYVGVVDINKQSRLLSFKSFNSKDGLALKEWLDLGRHAAIISGKSSPAVLKRFKDLGVKHIYLGVDDKKRVLKKIKKKLNLKYKHIACLGDDKNDLEIFKRSRYSFAPKDAYKINKSKASIVLSKKGGKGALREMIDIILSKKL